METKRLTVPSAEEIVDRYFPVLDHGFVALKDYMGGEEVGGTLYIDTDDTRGMPLNHLTKSECRTLELDEMSDFVPSIRSVEPEEAC